MKTRAAVAYEVNAPWQVEEFEINDPGPEEMLIKMSFAGLCHSDEHIRMGDFTEAALPMVCGHEGAGVVEAVGDHVRGFKPGDHVAASFIPSCGRCPSCASGMQYLCDNGAEIMAGSDKFFGERGPVKAMSGIGTFSEYAVVHENSVVPVGDWYPSKRSRCARAVLPPAGGRPSTSPRSPPATPWSWSAPAVSASMPSRARRWPGRPTSSPSTRSR